MTDVRHLEQTIESGRILPVVVLHAAAAADGLADALLAGGLRSVEVTFRTDAAADAIRAMARREELLVGAGTVTRVEQVDQAVEAGATFLVSPGFSAKVVARAQELRVPIFPGIATGTEIQMALDAGLSTVKFFPAEPLGGAPMVKALSAPFQNVRFIPTGGVTTANLAGYLGVKSVLAVGGTWMVAPDLLAAQDWAEVTARTAAALKEAAAC